MLRLDLMRLESPKRFQDLCFRLARREYPGSIGMRYDSWDGGSDIILLSGHADGAAAREVVWQAKFVRSLGSSTKRSIQDSIAKVRGRPRLDVGRWILCIPVDPTAPFLDWLCAETPKDWEIDVWGETRILELLEKNPDITEMFFYAVYEEIRQHFRSEKLELERLILDPSCQWFQSDPNVYLLGSGGFASPDLVLDIIVRNRGHAEAVLLAIEAIVYDCARKMHGVPEAGLLFPKIVYDVSVNRGNPGTYRSVCEPPLVVRADSVERFKIRVCNTGYAWNGMVRLILDYGSEKRLLLPPFQMFV